MGRIAATAATRVSQFVWLFLGLNLSLVLHLHGVEGRMFSPGGVGTESAKVFEACKYTWQLPGTDCWPPIGQSPHCDHLHYGDCAGSPPTVASVNDAKREFGAGAVSTESAKVFEACKFTWQLPGTDCWPPIGQSPHCDHLHDGDCAGSPPTLANVNQDMKALGADHGRVESLLRPAKVLPPCSSVPGGVHMWNCYDSSLSRTPFRPTT